MDPYKLISPRSLTQETLLEDLLGEQENLDALERDRQRMGLLRENIHQQRFAPWRVSKAVNELVAKKGMNRNPAFQTISRKIQEKGENWNVTDGGKRKTRKRKGKKMRKTRHHKKI